MNTDYNPKTVAKTIDVEELYDLDVTIARFILPRLMVFKEHTERTPRLNMSQEEWIEILDKMIYAFERIACQNAVCGGKQFYGLMSVIRVTI